MFVVFDLETTGLNKDSDDIIQFAYATFDDNNIFVKGEVLYFYYAGMSWSTEAENIHNIPQSFLAKYKDQFVPNIAKMYSILQQANVVGHNAEYFDCPFVKSWISRVGGPSLEFRSISDTMLAYKPFTKRARIKLTTLSEKRGLTPEFISSMCELWFGKDAASHSHDASYDVTATALLTLSGIKDGYMSFGGTPKAVVTNESSTSSGNIDDIDLNLDGLPRDPLGFAVKLQSQNNADINYRYVSTDVKKYANPIISEFDFNSYKSSGKAIAKPFIDKGGIYVLEHGIITLRLVPGEVSDSVTIQFDNCEPDDFLQYPARDKIISVINS